MAFNDNNIEECKNYTCGLMLLYHPQLFPKLLPEHEPKVCLRFAQTQAQGLPKPKPEVAWTLEWSLPEPKPKM